MKKVEHPDKGCTISFYKLADGRGWLHDFNRQDPQSPLIRVNLKLVKYKVMMEFQSDGISGKHVDFNAKDSTFSWVGTHTLLSASNTGPVGTVEIKQVRNKCCDKQYCNDL
jgi:hypothetical protein